MTQIRLCTVIAILGVLAIAVPSFAQSDAYGKPDACQVVLKETAKPNHWAVEINFTNDEAVFGLIFPLIISSSKGELSYDSTSFAGSRVDSFAVKIPYEDTSWTAKEASLRINLGMIGSISPSPIELHPGSGLIARHYISGAKDVTTESISVDTTFIGPSNRLLATMYDPDKGSIKPTFTFERAGGTKK